MKPSIKYFLPLALSSVGFAQPNPPQFLFDSTNGTAMSGCHNKGIQPTPGCPDCDDPYGQEGERSTGGSCLIDKPFKDARTSAKDLYTGLNMPSGCAPCGAGGGATGMSGLPALDMGRRFVSRADWFNHADFGFRNFMTGGYSARLNMYEHGGNQIRYSNHDMGRDMLFLTYDPVKQAWADTRDQGIFGCYLYDVNGTLITVASQRDNARTAIVVHHDGRTEHHDLFYTSTTTFNQVYSNIRTNYGYSRITSVLDRNGNAVTMTYADAIPTTGVVGNDPYKYFRRNTITDALGRTASFTYGPKIVNFYFIKTITHPSGEVTTYTNGADAASVPGTTFPIMTAFALKQVDHPDGMVSTITSSSEANSGFIKMKFNDPTSTSKLHRNMTLKIQGFTGQNSGGGAVSSTWGMARQVDSEVGETLFANRETAQGSLNYEGGNKVTLEQYDTTLVQRDYLKPTAGGTYPWVGGFHTFDSSTATYQKRFNATGTYNRLPNTKTDTSGRVKTLARNPISSVVTQTTNYDGSTTSRTVNAFQQPLTSVDALGRISNYTYDAKGNMLTSTQAVGTADETTTTYLYNLRGQVIESRDALYDASFPELHNTKYEYNTAGFLTKKIESADEAGGTRPETVYTYDTAGRLETSTDPLGRTTTYQYDPMSRVKRITYSDTSYEEFTYGTATANAGLLIEQRDRNGITTKYSYDLAGRKTEVKVAEGLPEESITTYTYLSGTSQPLTVTRNGETTTYQYDFFNRQTGSTVQANANTTLTSSTEFDQQGRTRSTTDAYGRKTFYLYDQNDRTIRTVTETVPGALDGVAGGTVPAITADATQTSAAHTYSLSDLAGNTLSTSNTHKVTYTCARDLFLEGLTRETMDDGNGNQVPATNAKYLITDTVYDSEGQSLISTDARGINSWTEYDELGRTKLSIMAVGTPAEIRSQSLYDDNSNVVESRSPRYFTEGNGATSPTVVGAGQDTYTYNGRNMRKSHTTAPGATAPDGNGGTMNIEATQSWTYYLDGRSDEHTDFRGNVSKTLWHICCGRLQASVQRDGLSTSINNTDFKGQVTHTAVVKTNPAAGGQANPNWHDPVNVDTLRETTTRYDGRGRPTHSTVWLQPLGNVDDDARISLGDAAGIPIAGLDGIPAANGLTTTYQYDEDLTDGAGIDADYSTQFSELTTRYGYNPFGAGANGYATKVTNAAGESSVSVTDGAGRTIMTINPEGHITTMHYDVVTGTVGTPTAATPIPGNLLKNTATDANGNSNHSYSDAAGRTLATEDAIGNFSYAGYNANGSVTVSRDANELGQTCDYDALNRATSCGDLEEISNNTVRSTTYNAASQAVTTTNAEGHSTSAIYDARDRRISSTDANNITTNYVFDKNNNLTALIDGNGNKREWVYDARNLNTAKIYPGNGGNDNYSCSYDALGRKYFKMDQLGDTKTSIYDLAGRMTSLEYRTGGTTLESTDTYTYDNASRIIQTVKGRHNITTQHTYALDSMPLTETVVADGRTYTMSRTYDPANRPLTHTYPDGKVTTWVYDVRNLVTTVTYEGENVVTNTYDVGYRVTQEAYGNGLTRNIFYNRMDNLRTLDQVKKGGTVVKDLTMSYSYALDKQITAETFATGGNVQNASFTATYDAGNRLTNWNRPNGIAGIGNQASQNQTWTFDDAGNWTSTVIDGNTQNRTHAVNDQITLIGGNAATHDLKGNLLTFEHANKDYTLEYDLDNRLIKADVDNTDVEYRYDAFGRRILRKEGSTETALLWWGNSECAEYKHQAGQAAIQNDIFCHPNRLNAVIARAKDGSKFEIEWYHKNYLDHVYAVSKDNGNILEHYRYNAYGEVQIYSVSGTLLNSTQIDNHITWNTRRQDSLTGFHMYKFRHYIAPLGRWAGRDPIEEEGGVNLYGFVGNDSVNAWDYLGLWKKHDNWAGQRRNYKGTVCAEEGDTFRSLAKRITGNSANWGLMVKWSSETRKPIETAVIPGKIYDIGVFLADLELRLREAIVKNAVKFHTRGPYRALFAQDSISAQYIQDYFAEGTCIKPADCTSAMALVNAQSLIGVLQSDVFGTSLKLNQLIDYFELQKGITAKTSWKGDQTWLQGWTGDKTAWKGINIVNLGNGKWWGWSGVNKPEANVMSIEKWSDKVKRKGTRNRGASFVGNNDEIYFLNVVKIAELNWKEGAK